MYRTRVVDPLIRSQMANACDILHDWKKFKPIIAGGSLWSWAAGKPARDIDIFIKSTWRARRKARSLVTDKSDAGLKVQIIKNGYFGEIEVIRKLKNTVYTAVMPDGTPVDIILSSVGGTKVLQYFDYRHCAVAFCPPCTTDLTGARSYTAGELEMLHKKARSKEMIISKIQRGLWGSVDAKEELVRVIHELKDIYLNKE